VQRRDVAAWLHGPGRGTSVAAGYPGERLGRPEHGPGAVAGFGRRILGITIDWLLCLLIAHGLLHGGAFTTLGVFAVEQALLVGTAGAAIGHRIVGLRVETLAGGFPGPLRGVIRAVLLCLAVPALIWDRDQRGLHDQAAGTVLVQR